MRDGKPYNACVVFVPYKITNAKSTKIKRSPL